MTFVQKLPPVNEDPDIRAGYDAQSAWAAENAAIRADQMLSDLAKAEKIDAAWRAYRTAQADREKRFWQRRRDRLATIERTVPVGPGPDVAKASPADAAVLQSAFRAAYVEAAEYNAQQQAVEYQQAERFGDHLRARAVLTAAQDAGNSNVLQLWAKDDPTKIADLEEAGNLRQLLTGVHIDLVWVTQAFDRGTGVAGLGGDRQPAESKNLDQLRLAAGIKHPGSNR